MHNAPPPYLMTGIQLVQAGRRADALPYLRYAAQNEPINAEGWLWLAAATDDLEEYRACVNHALRLDRTHPVASRMRAELERLTTPARTPSGGMEAVPSWLGASVVAPDEDTAARRRGQHRPARHRLRWVLAVMVLVAIVAAALIVSGVLQDAVDTAQNSSNATGAHTLDFTVGATDGYRFRVEVPDSWLPANTDSPDWKAARDSIAAAFPVPEGQIGVWQQVEASFSAVTRDPVYGVMLPQPRLVETDIARLTQSGVVTTLTLSEIVPLPDLTDGQSGDLCARMQLLQAQFQADNELATQPGNTLLKAELVTRGNLGDCAYWIERRYTGQNPSQVPFPVTIDRAPDTIRTVLIAVPVGTERYALWTVSLADSAYDDYANTIARIVDTLVTVSGD